jgi:hypothetical protein
VLRWWWPKTWQRERRKNINGRRKTRGRGWFPPPPNFWLKCVIMVYQKLVVKGYLSWSLSASATAVVVSINQKEPYRGMFKCQVIMVVYVLLNLVKRWSIKFSWKVATRTTF